MMASLSMTVHYAQVARNKKNSYDFHLHSLRSAKAGSIYKVDPALLSCLHMVMMASCFEVMMIFIQLQMVGDVKLPGGCWMETMLTMTTMMTMTMRTTTTITTTLA